MSPKHQPKKTEAQIPRLHINPDSTWKSSKLVQDGIEINMDHL
jgi:hypothetical protein